MKQVNVYKIIDYLDFATRIPTRGALDTGLHRPDVAKDFRMCGLRGFHERL
jgi:hypothetical protein